MANEISERTTAVEQFAVGVAETAAEVVSDPVTAARKQVRSFERKGAPAVRRINRRINAMMPERLKVFGVDVNGKLPENMTIKGLHMIRLQARRPDIFGDVAKQTLRVFNRSFKTIARTATRFEEATELAPHRETVRKPAARSPRRRAVRRHAA